MMRTALVAASLCAPAAASVAGFHWGFDEAPETGLTDVSFPLTLSAASGAGAYSFYQGFSFGDASDSSIGLTLKSGNATNSTAGCPSLTAFFNTKADSALAKSSSCSAASSGAGLTCEVTITPCIKLGQSAFTLLIEKLEDEGAVAKRWWHGPGGKGPAPGGKGPAPGGEGPHAPPSGPWGPHPGWDNSTANCNKTVRAPAVRRWWFDGPGPAPAGPRPAGGAWAGSNITHPPFPTGTAAPTGGYPMGTAAPTGGYPKGTGAPKPRFRGAGRPIVRREAPIEARVADDAAVWRGSLVDASGLKTEIGLWQLAGAAGVQPAHTGGVSFPKTAAGLPKVTVEFGNPTTSTSGASGGVIAKPFFPGSWTVSNNTVSLKGFKMTV